MDQRHLVHDALGELTRAVDALGDALQQAGVVGEEAPDGDEASNGAPQSPGEPFVPILIPMEVLRAWGALAPGAAAPDSAEVDSGAPSPPPAAAPIAAGRGPVPPDGSLVPEGSPAERGTWVWTWEHPTPDGERVEDEIDGGR